MNWLLVVIVLKAGAGGTLTQEAVFRKTYISESECNHVGGNFREIFKIPQDRKTFSICIPPEWFNESDWKVHEAEPGA